MSKVLLVEDGLVVAFHLKIILETNGYEVVAHLTHGEEVFETFKQLNPDILILDIMLGGEMTGIEVARKIRTISEVPIIFMSALTDNGTLDEIDQISNSLKHNKPLNEGLLIKEVAKMLF